MIGYIRVGATAIPLPYRGGLDTDSERPISFITSLGGKRTALLGPRVRREWSVSFDLMGARESAGLVSAARSAGEVGWFPADAVSGNLLSPQAQQWETAPSGATKAGVAALPDGTFADSVSAAGVVQVGTSHGSYELVPLLAGSDVSVGGWGFGGLRLQGFWRDAAGVSMGSFASPISTHAGWGYRSHTMTPPAGAAGLQLSMSNGTAYARPSVSWGSVPWDSPGRGCPRAVVHGLSESLSVISSAEAYGSVGVTITEVG